MCPEIVSSTFFFGMEQNLSFSCCFPAELAAATIYLILAGHFHFRKKSKQQTIENWVLPHYLTLYCVSKICITFRLSPLILYLLCPPTLL